MNNKLTKEEINDLGNYPMGEYRLIDVQRAILLIMIEFDKICRKIGVKYILDGGSLLGAVRHNGFIPWDDDMDVAMLRSDYQKLIRYIKKNSQIEYEFCSTSSCKIWPYNFGKFIKNNTIYEETFLKNLPINHGLWIDVFPMDNTFKCTYKIQSKLSRFWQDVRWTKNGISECNCFKPKHKKLLRMLSHLPFWFINLNSELSIRLFNFLPCRNVCKLCHPGKGKVPHAKYYYNNIIEHSFCGKMFYIPKDYNNWLNIRYKNPMELPKKEDRVPSHFGGIIKL